MDVWRITVAVLRRWYVFLPLLALTAFGALRVGEGVDPAYEVTATSILVPGTEESEIAAPYGNMDNTNQVLSIVLDANAARDGIAGSGLNPDYEIVARDRSSIMNLSVLSQTAEESLATIEAVLALGSQELAQRQDAAGIPPEAQIRLQVLRAPSVSDVVVEGKMRNMVVVGIVGAGLSLLVAVLFDDLVELFRRWLRRRRERKQTQIDEAPTERGQPRADGPLEDQTGNERSAPREASAAGTGVSTASEEMPVNELVVEASSQNGGHVSTDLAPASRKP